MRTTPLAIIVVAGLALWLLFEPFDKFFQKESAEPRAVTARGDLAKDELNTIDVLWCVYWSPG